MPAAMHHISQLAVRRLLKPRSVAIVGASATVGALGSAVLANLQRMRFGGEIHLINPNREEINGRRCLKAVADLPAGVDVAVLAIPRAGVLDAMRGLAARQIGAAIIFSSGYAEGGASGLAEQVEIADIAARANMIVEGPNCLGLVNHVDGIALTFVDTPALPLNGRPGIGIVSQSGAMACVLAVMLASRDLAVSYSVSTGNEAVSGAEDYLEYLIEDPQTSTIAMIVEQFRQPRRFLRLARRASAAGKTIVLLHPGRSLAARQSAATHTGAMAGDYSLMRIKVAAERVVLADTLEELGDVTEIAHRCVMPICGGALAITESGAFKALTLDLCEEVQLPLPAITDTTAPALRAAMPEFVAVSNPLDLTAQGLVDPDLYRRVVLAAADDARFAAIVLAVIQTDPATCDRKFPSILQGLRESGRRKPVIVAGLDEGAAVPPQYIAELRDIGIPYFPSTERALRALRRLTASAVNAPLGAVGGCDSNLTRPQAGVVPEYLAKEYLRRAGVPFLQGILARNFNEVEHAAATLGYPLVLKAQSSELPHKSDVGGVILNIADSAQLARAWQALHANVNRHRPGLALDGVLVEPMSSRGVELIVGARNDPEWGPVVLAGFGGVQAELIKDVCLMLPGQSRDSVITQLYSLRGGALFKGFRGSPALDVDAVAALVERLGGLLCAQPRIVEIDLNPVIVHSVGKGVIALDALMNVSVPHTPEELM